MKRIALGSAAFIACAVFIGFAARSKKVLSVDWFEPHSVRLLKSIPDVISVEPYQAEDYLKLAPAAIGNLSFEKYQKCIERLPTMKMDFYRVWYKSDGLRVQALLGLPKNFDINKSYQLIILNRGGNRALGYFTVCHLADLEDFGSTLNRAIVLAPQYRGSPSSEGNDEFGGHDVDDILKATEIASELPYIDRNNRFIIGWSRGGMMTYLTLKRSNEFRAAVVIAGPTDLVRGETERPEMAQLQSILIPGYVENRIGVLTERSAVRWPEKIQTPVLIMHGTADWRVSAQDAKDMAAALERVGKEHRLILYEGSGHDLDGAYQKMLGEVSHWLTSHFNERKTDGAGARLAE